MKRNRGYATRCITTPFRTTLTFFQVLLAVSNHIQTRALLHQAGAAQSLPEHLLLKRRAAKTHLGHHRSYLHNGGWFYLLDHLPMHSNQEGMDQISSRPLRQQFRFPLVLGST